MKRILIIDQDDFFIEVMSCFLAHEGFQIDSCRDGKSGLYQAFSNDFDVVLCDAQLEDISGFEVANQIKKHATSYPTKVFVTAPSNNIISISLDQELNYDAYVQKPISFNELLRLIYEESNEKEEQALIGKFN
jgi:DNA-binding response OmpR family regulator